MVTNEHGLYYWNKDSGEKRWQLEEGSNPRWWWPVRRPWRQLTMATWLWVLVRGGADCACVLLVSYGGFWKNFLFYVASVALFALGVPQWIHVYGRLCIFYVEVDLNPETFSPFG